MECGLFCESFPHFGESFKRLGFLDPHFPCHVLFSGIFQVLIEFGETRYVVAEVVGERTKGDYIVQRLRTRPISECLSFAWLDGAFAFSYDEAKHRYAAPSEFALIELELDVTFSSSGEKRFELSEMSVEDLIGGFLSVALRGDIAIVHKDAEKFLFVRSTEIPKN